MEIQKEISDSGWNLRGAAPADVSTSRGWYKKGRGPTLPGGGTRYSLSREAKRASKDAFQRGDIPVKAGMDPSSRNSQVLGLCSTGEYSSGGTQGKNVGSGEAPPRASLMEKASHPTHEGVFALRHPRKWGGSKTGSTRGGQAAEYDSFRRG